VLLLLQDNDVPLEALQTFKDMRPKEISRMTSQLLFPLNVKGDRQYYFNNIHESDILEREVRREKGVIAVCRIISSLLQENHCYNTGF
jgi:hypothetical protein